MMKYVERFACELKVRIEFELTAGTRLSEANPKRVRPFPIVCIRFAEACPCPFFFSFGLMHR
jgi:hypothetical protein